MIEKQIRRIIPIEIVAANLTFNGEPEYDDSQATGFTVPEGLFTPGNIGAKIFPNMDDDGGYGYAITGNKDLEDEEYLTRTTGWKGQIEVAALDTLEEDEYFGRAQALRVTSIEPFCVDTGINHSDPMADGMLSAGCTLNWLTSAETAIKRKILEMHRAPLSRGIVVVNLDGQLKPYCDIPMTDARNKAIITHFDHTDGKVVFHNADFTAANTVQALRTELYR